MGRVIGFYFLSFPLSLLYCKWVRYLGERDLPKRLAAAEEQDGG